MSGPYGGVTTAIPRSHTYMRDGCDGHVRPLRGCYYIHSTSNNLFGILVACAHTYAHERKSVWIATRGGLGHEYLVTARIAHAIAYHTARQRHDCHLGSDATPKPSDPMGNQVHWYPRIPEARRGGGAGEYLNGQNVPQPAGRSSSSLRAQPTALPFLHRPTDTITIYVYCTYIHIP
jgi:hypothetical protein